MGDDIEVWVDGGNLRGGNGLVLLHSCHGFFSSLSDELRQVECSGMTGDILMMMMNDGEGEQIGK